MQSNIKYLFFFLFALLIISCKKDEEIVRITPILTPKEKVVNNLVRHLTLRNDESLDLGCFEVKFPFGVQTENGPLTFQNQSDFEASMNTPTGIVIIDFIYPLNVTNEGQDLVINNIEELANLYASCIPESGWGNDDFPAYLLNYENSCYTLVYPVTVKDDDGAAFTANNENELADQLAANPALFFTWPLNLEKQDGSQLTAYDSENLFKLLTECDNIPTPWDSIDYKTIGCFEVVFPISFVTIDGSVLTANNSDEMTALILSGNTVGFSYPINLSGTITGTITVASDEELINLINEHCNVVIIEDAIFYLLSGSTEVGSGCYELIFPFSIPSTTTGSIEVNSLAELKQIMETSPTPVTGLIYPVSVKLTTTNQVMVIDDLDELLELLQNCN